MQGDRWRQSHRVTRVRRNGRKQRPSFRLSNVGLALWLEPLESRLLLTIPAVISIDRFAPLAASTGTAGVSYQVTFSEAVTNVDASDFAVTNTLSVSTALPVDVTGSGAVYLVNIAGIQGDGQLRLDLVDNDSIQNSSNTPLGDVGAGNGNFQGQTYTIDQVAPFVQSINGTTPANLSTGARSVVYTVIFSEAVTDVDAADFALSLTGTVTANPLVAVDGSDSAYTVQVSDISGSGTLRLRLTDDGSILDSSGNRLVTANAPATFANQAVLTTGFVPIYLTTADVNKDGYTDQIVANFRRRQRGSAAGQRRCYFPE